MIQNTGIFIDTATFTAGFVLKMRERMKDGLLFLRDIPRDEPLADPVDLPILKEWGAARLLLKRMKLDVARVLKVSPAELGKVWIETLPGEHGTPWTIEEDDYAQAHVRTRTALIVAPNAFTMSGLHRELLGVGVVNLVEHRILHSEINLSIHPRTHLIIDVRRPEAAVEE